MLHKNGNGALTMPSSAPEPREYCRSKHPPDKSCRIFRFRYIFIVERGDIKGPEKGSYEDIYLIDGKIPSNAYSG